MNKIHLRIGASLNNEVIIEDSGIDAFHLELFCDEYRNVFITNLSINIGTFVNSQSLNGFRLLKSGDEVRLGKTFILDWEKLVLNSNFYKKKEGEVRFAKSEESPTPTLTKTPTSPLSSKRKDSYKINRQLFIIYGLIILVISLMFFVL